MPFEITLSKHAVKDFERLPESVQERINEGIVCLRENPYTSRSGRDIRKLKGLRPAGYALRVGDYRIIYTVERNLVRVTSVKHRSIAYR